MKVQFSSTIKYSKIYCSHLLAKLIKENKVASAPKESKLD